MPKLPPPRALAVVDLRWIGPYKTILVLSDGRKKEIDHIEYLTGPGGKFFMLGMVGDGTSQQVPDRVPLPRWKLWRKAQQDFCDAWADHLPEDTNTDEEDAMDRDYAAETARRTALWGFKDGKHETSAKVSHPAPERNPAPKKSKPAAKLPTKKPLKPVAKRQTVKPKAKPKKKGRR
jgi:hypothetical protein